jgi:hypothetical protein
MSFINQLFPAARRALQATTNAVKPQTRRTAILGHGRWLRLLLDCSVRDAALTNCQYERLLVASPCFNRTGRIL